MYLKCFNRLLSLSCLVEQVRESDTKKKKKNRKKEFIPLPYHTQKERVYPFTLSHVERPKLYTILAFLSAIGLKCQTADNKIFISAKLRKSCFVQVENGEQVNSVHPDEVLMLI